LFIQFIQGKNRTQSVLFPENLDQIIEEQNEVRSIDLFVEGIKLDEYKFVIKTTFEGRPAYHPKDLLKLFVYGYLNQLRSSRVLEKECKRNIEVMWLMKELAPDTAYNVAHFIYHQAPDNYTCPQGQQLNTNGPWYNKDRGKTIVRIKQYKTKAWLTCPAFALCTKNKEGRQIERSEHQAYRDQNRLNIAANPNIYKRRQAIVEHPYGIIKRQWGLYYITTKPSMKRASADVGLMFVAFNLRRLINIIDKNEFKKFLQGLAFFYWEYLPLQKHSACISRIPIFAQNSLFFNIAFHTSS